MVNVFKGRFVACALSCFFVENKMGSKIQKYAPELNQAFWIKASKPTTTRRKTKKLSTQRFTDEMKSELKRYNRVVDQFIQKYPEMFEEGKLSRQSAQVELDSSKTENKLECPVCFDNIPVSKMVCCNVSLEDSNISGSEVFASDQPSTSSETATEPDSKDVTDQSGDQSELIEENFAAHTFCRTCVRCHAVAATHEIPLAEGGVGLKCMVPGCKNPILYSEIRHLLKKDTKKKLDERIIEETWCNFAVEIDTPPEVNKVFDCPSCNHQFCRLCKSDWDDDHIGITCDELSFKMKRHRKDRNLEQQLNEAIIRKCPKCSIAFTKSEGCNKMTCRCGCTQCYICREIDIKYTHFCQHFRDPAKKDAKCNQCDKTCLLWEDSKKLDDQTIENIKQQSKSSDGEQSAVSQLSANNIYTQEAVNDALDSFLAPRLPDNFANYGAPQLPAGGNHYPRHRNIRDRFGADPLNNNFLINDDVTQWVQTGGKNILMNVANQQEPANPYQNNYGGHQWNNNNFQAIPFNQDYVNPYAPVQHQQMPPNYAPMQYPMPQLAPHVPLHNPFLQHQFPPATGQATPEAVYNPQVNTFQVPNNDNSQLGLPAPAAINPVNNANTSGLANAQEMFVGLMMPPADDAIAEFDDFLLNYANNPTKTLFYSDEEK
uniref:RING-type domain-containing protein n=1 Tax=Ditylenchus dipsaci TaxID=166011 RepID=A0A915EDH2_9BILA